MLRLCGLTFVLASSLSFSCVSPALSGPFVTATVLQPVPQLFLSLLMSSALRLLLEAHTLHSRIVEVWHSLCLGTEDFAEGHVKAKHERTSDEEPVKRKTQISKEVALCGLRSMFVRAHSGVCAWFGAYLLDRDT